MKRRIKKARITHISLVKRGANKMPVLYKSDGQVELQTLVKEGEEGEILAVVYAPESVDSQGDVASAEVIKEMAYDAMKRGVEIDIQHNLESLEKDQAWVAESFLIQKGDERFEGMTDYSGAGIPSLEGAWATVIKVEDPELRKAFREGDFNGVSMFGQAEVEAVKEDTSDEAINQLLSKLAEKLSPLPANEEIEMSKEELEALLAQREEALLSKIDARLETVSKAEEAEEEVESTEPVFKGDLTNPADVAAHVDRLKAARLRKSVDVNDLEQMTALQAALGEAPEVESRVASLEKNLAQILKGSSVDRTKEPSVPAPKIDWDHDFLTKEDLDGIALGKELAKWLDASEAN